MILEQNQTIEKFSKNSGYLFSYFVFTTILYFILTLLKKVPSAWSYVHIMIITFGITVLGVIFKRLLK